MKVGRNQPCPCGSGKKYKKCCLSKEKVSSDLLYRRLGEAHDRLAHRLMRYGLKEFGEGALGVALDEFMAWPDEGLSQATHTLAELWIAAIQVNILQGRILLH